MAQTRKRSAQTNRKTSYQSSFDGNAARKLVAQEPLRKPRKKSNVEEPVRQPRKKSNAKKTREQQAIARIKEQEKLIRLNEKQIRQSRFQNVKVGSVLMACFSVVVVMTLVMLSVSSQVKVNELTTAISSAESELMELQSVEVQLVMEAANTVDTSEILEYVEQELGMGKVSDSQINYINLAIEDEGVVYAEKATTTWDKILAFFGFEV